jgi:peptidyl-prolyl cis-trans isomerase A (cyclophilin A)
MKFHFYLILFGILILSCQNQTKDNAKILPEQKKETKPAEKTSEDLMYEAEDFEITDENKVAFLTWYGQRNPENEVVIETKFGHIELELYKNTPLHRANFIYLVKKEYFNTTYFHRVVKDFIIQGGNSDEWDTSRARKKIGKYLLPPEFVKTNQHDYGALAAARLWENNPEMLSNPYEYYIIQSKTGSHHLDGKHTVFGRVTKGMDVVDAIAKQPIDEREFPLQNIEVKIRIK